MLLLLRKQRDIGKELVRSRRDVYKRTSAIVFLKFVKSGNGC